MFSNRKRRLIEGEIFKKNNVVFEDQNLERGRFNIWIRDTHFRTCKFEKQNFSRISFCGRLGCIFDSCDFDGTKFNNLTSFENCVFESCRFSKINWTTTINFGNTIFKQCVFDGQVKDMWIQGEHVFPNSFWEKFHFRRVEKLRGGIVDVDFSGCDLQSLSLSHDAMLSGVKISSDAFWTTRTRMQQVVREPDGCSENALEYSKTLLRFFHPTSDEFHLVARSGTNAFLEGADFDDLRNHLECQMRPVS